MTPRELAELACVPPQMIYNYIRAERIKAALDENNRYVIDDADADAWLAEHRKRKIARKRWTK